MRNQVIAILLTVTFCLLYFNGSLSKNYSEKIIPNSLSQINLSSDKVVRVLVSIDKNKFSYEYSSVEEDLKSIGKIEYKFRFIPAVDMKIPSYRIEELSKLPYVVKIDSGSLLKTSSQPNLEIINASRVWSGQITGTNITGKGTSVCIIDTGVNYTHPDLGGCYGSGCKVISGHNFIDGTEDPMDDNGHGTSVAGIIAANGSIKGVAPDANIVAVKISNSTGSANWIDLGKGIEWCIGNANSYNISVISISWGSDTNYTGYCDDDPSYSDLTQIINYAVGNNISVVVSTGNSGNLTGIAYPACIKNVMSVAATYDSDIGQGLCGFCNDTATYADKIACFSNRNSITNFLAPGVSIYTTNISSNYRQFSGTSAATPHVSGSVLLLYQKYKMIYNSIPTPDYLKQILNQSGVKINDTDGTNLNFTRIDVYAASQMIDDTTAPKWYYQSDSSTVERGSNITLYADWIDDAILSYAILSTNETGQFENRTVVNLHGSESWSNFTWSNASLANGTNVVWKIYANDTSNNQNVTDDFNFTIIDTTGPVHFNLKNSTDTVYDKNKNYTFNVTFSDFSNISKVFFEWNLSSNISDVGNVAIDSTTQEYFVNRTDLAAGNYVYRWFANDTANNWNVTELQAYNIAPTPTSTSLYLNGIQNSRTYYRGEIANITAIINASSLNVTVSANYTGNSVDIANSASSVSNATNTSNLDIGLYNITAYYNGYDSNYSVSTQTYLLISREIYRNSSVNIQNNTLTLINASNLNVILQILTNDTLTDQLNITAGLDNPTGIYTDFGIGKFISIEDVNSTKNLIFVIINVSYSNISNSIDENSLRLYYWNTTDWIKYDSTNGGVNVIEKYVWANSTHLSNFTVAGSLVNGQNCSSDSNCSSNICYNSICSSSIPTTTTTTQNSGSPSGGGTAGPEIKPCLLNGICDSWETPGTCPSDCKAEVANSSTTTTTTTNTVPTTTTTTTQITTTTTTQAALTSEPSGMTGFSAILNSPAAVGIIITAIIGIAFLVWYKKWYAPRRSK